MKRKVLFLIESLSGGGAEKVLSVLLKYFNYEKYEVTLCPIVDTGVYCDEAKSHVDHYTPVVSFHGNAISRFLNRVKYKLIYSYLPLSCVYKFFIPKGNDVEIAFCEGYVTKLLAHSGSKAKKIVWVHTDLRNCPWTVESGVFKGLADERSAYAMFNKIVTVSQTAELSFHERYGLEDLTVTIYNPIDIEDIKRKASNAVRNHHNDVIKIISVGRLVAPKGYDRLLRVAKRLHEDGYQFHLLILGEGEMRQQLETYITDNDMHSYVSLPGFTSNPYVEMKQSDLFVCSSRAEGFSLVAAEAMVLGIPVVSTYCSGPNELLKDGKYGLLVENSEEGLYQGIKMLLNDHAKLKEFGELSMLRGRQFGIDEAKRLIEQLLEEQ